MQLDELLNDIHYEAGYNAHRGTSFVAEQRAKMTTEQTQTYKSNLSDIEIGDFVVVVLVGWDSKNDYDLRKVDRVTKTQIVVGDKKFNRNGYEVGVASSWRSDYIYAPLHQYDDDRTWLVIAESDMAKRAEKARRTELTKVISDRLGSASIEMLERVVDLLNT